LDVVRDGVCMHADAWIMYGSSGCRADVNLVEGCIQFPKMHEVMMMVMMRMHETVQVHFSAAHNHLLPGHAPGTTRES